MLNLNKIQIRTLFDNDRWYGSIHLKHHGVQEVEAPTFEELWDKLGALALNVKLYEDRKRQ